MSFLFFFQFFFFRCKGMHDDWLVMGMEKW